MTITQQSAVVFDEQRAGHMPAVCTTTDDEYTALRHGCGLIDYRDCGLFSVSGLGATAFVGHATTRSADFLLEGQIVAALLLRGEGTIVAEVLIHCLGSEHLLEVWPVQRQAAWEHLQELAGGSDDVALIDVSDRFQVFGLEGPQSFKAAGSLLPFSISSVAYRRFVTVDWSGSELLMSRTGVTGEYGYKLRVPAELGDALRDQLLGLRVTPCGSDALDICRMEMRFPNLERESGDGAVTPFDLGLQWMVDFHHDFVGRDALLSVWETERRHPVCWLAEPGMDRPPAFGAPIVIDGHEVGYVAHAVWSPTLERVIGTARVDAALAASGLEVGVGRVPDHARTVSAPFLVATSFRIPLE